MELERGVIVVSIQLLVTQLYWQKDKLDGRHDLHYARWSHRNHKHKEVVIVELLQVGSLFFDMSDTGERAKVVNHSELVMQHLISCLVNFHATRSTVDKVLDCLHNLILACKKAKPHIAASCHKRVGESTSH